MRLALMAGAVVAFVSGSVVRAQTAPAPTPPAPAAAPGPARGTAHRTRSQLLRRVLRVECWRIRRRGSLPYGCAIAAAALIMLLIPYRSFVG